MYNHILTEKGLEIFDRDWAAAHKKERIGGDLDAMDVSDIGDIYISGLADNGGVTTPVPGTDISSGYPGLYPEMIQHPDDETLKINLS